MDEILFFQKVNWQGNHHHCFGGITINQKRSLEPTFSTTYPLSYVIKSGLWELSNKTGDETIQKGPGLYNLGTELGGQLAALKFIEPQETKEKIAETIIFDAGYFKGKHHHIFGTKRGDGDPQLGNTPAKSTTTFHNATSSIIIKSGVWGFLDANNYTGAEFNRLGPGMYALLHKFNIYNDKVDSIMLYGTTEEELIPNECIIFSKKDAQGIHHHVFGCDNMLSESSMHHNTKSIIIKKGKWKFYGAPSFGGAEYWENNTLGSGFYLDITKSPLNMGLIDSIRQDVDPIISK
jgi:hypothetical protein